LDFEEEVGMLLSFLSFVYSEIWLN
jgi:hypothetical protein